MTTTPITTTTQEPYGAVEDLYEDDNDDGDDDDDNDDSESSADTWTLCKFNAPVSN